MVGLNLPDLDRLINDPIHHDASWPAMPTKLPSDIPKFEGLAGEYPSNHVRSFHMWCSSTSITNDSVGLQLFQRTLIGAGSKWYVDQPPSSHTTFATLARDFLFYFQLPLRYDTGIELLTSFCQSSATRLSDHVQEWWRRKSLCQSPTFEDCVYMDWFLRSLLPPIGKDVASHFPQTEEAALQLVLKYDLISA